MDFTVGPLPNVGFGGVSATFQGNASYTDTDTSAEEKLTRTIWRTEPFDWIAGDQPLNMARATQFEGYEMQTSGNEDAWGVGVNLIEFAGNFFEPLDIISAVADISVTLGLDVIEETYLQTQFVTGYYTDDNFATFDNFLINGATQRGWIEIPDDLSLGETYDIQMVALGTGFTALIEYFLQGNVDFELILLSLFDIDLGEIDIGDAIEVEDWVTRFHYGQSLHEDFGGWMDDAEFAEAALSFLIVDDAADQDPSTEPDTWELAQVDPLIGQLIDDEVDESELNHSFPLNPQAGPSIITPIPEPATLLLLGSGLLGLLGFGRRKKAF
jgi:hypothetical protein